MNHPSIQQTPDVHPPSPQTSPVGLTSSCNEAQLLKELQWERLRSDTLEKTLAELRKELDCQRKELDCQRKEFDYKLASSLQLLEDADCSREELEMKLSKGLKALTGSDCILLRPSLQNQS